METTYSPPVQETQDRSEQNDRKNAPKSDAFKAVMRKKEEEKFEKNREDNQSNLHSPFSPAFAAHAQSAQKSAEVKRIGEVSVQLEQLAEQLEGHMMSLKVAKDEMDLTTTFLREGSPFHKMEINLKHFSTAPDSFHINLYGTPEAAEILHQNLHILVAKLENKVEGMQFHFLPPFIKDERLARKNPKLESSKRVTMVQEKSV